MYLCSDIQYVNLLNKLLLLKFFCLVTHFLLPETKERKKERRKTHPPNKTQHNTTQNKKGFISQ